MECQSLTKKSDIETQQWYNILKDYFNVDLDGDTVRRWWDEMATSIRNVNNSMICHAIRWASDSANYKRSDKAGKPTVVEVIRWIRMSVGASMSSTALRPACDICDRTGWVAYYPDWKKDWSVSQYFRAYSAMVPCACETGQMILRKNKPYCDMTPDQANAMVDMAHSAAKARKAMYEAVRNDVIDTGAAAVTRI